MGKRMAGQRALQPPAALAETGLALRQRSLLGALRGSRLGSSVVLVQTLLRSTLRLLPVRGLALLRTACSQLLPIRCSILGTILVPALQVSAMATPYWLYAVPPPAYGYYYYDPIALIYAWIHLWIHWVSALYYLEFFKTMIETWRRMLESTLKTVPAAPASATA